jgi:hypothetical protein
VNHVMETFGGGAYLEEVGPWWCALGDYCLCQVSVTPFCFSVMR